MNDASAAGDRAFPSVPQTVGGRADQGRKWLHFADVLSVLVSRDFKGQHKNTALGMLWALISPLLFLLTFYVVFEIILNLGRAHYAAFVFTGLLGWIWFQSSLSQAVLVITSSANLVGQPGFPITALPVLSVMSNLLNFAISLPILLIIIWLDVGALTWAVLALPVVIIVQFCLTLGFAYVVAALNVRFRDTQYILPAILQLGYFAVPIFYDATQVPEEYRFFFAYNPVARLVDCYRAILIEGRLPDWPVLAVVFAGSIGLLAAGYYLFRRASYSFLEEL